MEPLEDRSLLSTVPVGPEFQVNSYTTSDQLYPAIAMDDSGDFVVAWWSYGQDGDGYGIYAQRYDAAGAAQGPEFRVNSTTVGDQTLPAVAMDADGDFVVTWTSTGQYGDGDGVFAQRYNAAGAPQGAEFQVNTTTAGNQFGRTVAMDDDGDFVVAWTSDGQDGDDYGVYAQRFNAAGVPQGGEILVNSYTTGRQMAPDVAIDADGDFVVAWMSEFQDGSEYGVYAQRFNAAGAPQGGETLVNTYTGSTQQFPAVAIDADGDYVVAWESYGQDGNDYGTYAQRFNAAGTPQGGEFRVNSYTSSVQWYADVAMDDDGNFAIVWESTGQDGDSEGVYLQAYNASGSPQSVELKINTYTPFAQRFPAVAMDADGDFRVAWMSDFQDGSGFGIFSQQFANAPSVVGRELFYNQSKFDGNTAGIDDSDDGAIAPDKSAYLPGSGPATFDSISSYSRGINGVMVDVDSPAGTLTLADFTFKMSEQSGANNTPSTWSAAPAPSGFSVRPGAGVDGSDRVVIVWNNNAIENRWLEVTVEGNDAAGGFNTNTGLLASDLFYFGNRIGDTGSGTASLALTTALDEITVRTNMGFGASITNLLDFDRSGLVTAFDSVLSRNNLGALTKINLTNPPAAPSLDEGGAIALALAVPATTPTAAGSEWSLPLGEPTTAPTPAPESVPAEPEVAAASSIESAASDVEQASLDIDLLDVLLDEI
ncbi:MAG: hypothetical protein DWQ37_19470 [Planctomycetota bacterium]|nr:MAG: hypothetical protein DWQ37_19470 [Planctomycetota bacterium]